MYRFTCISLFIGYLFLAYWLCIGQFYQTNNDAYVSGNIIKIYSDNHGHVSSLLVKENTLVIKGQPIARIDNAAAYLKLKNAKEALANAIKQANDMNHIAGILQNNTRIALKAAENTLTISQKKYRTSLNAYSNQSISLETLEQDQINVENASDVLEDARLKYNAAMSLPIYQSITDTPLVRQAIEQLRLAYLNWVKSTIYAPDTGYITTRNVVTGQAVNTRTVLMTMVPLNQMWVNIDIKPSQLKNISYGEPVKLITHLDNQNKTYKGIILGRNDKPQSTADGLVSIRIQMDPEALLRHPLPFGLAMTAVIDTRHHDSKLLKIDNKPRTLLSVTDYREELIPTNQIIDKIVQDNTQTKIPPPHFGNLVLRQ